MMDIWSRTTATAMHLIVAELTDIFVDVFLVCCCKNIVYYCGSAVMSHLYYIYHGTSPIILQQFRWGRGRNIHGETHGRLSGDLAAVEHVGTGRSSGRHIRLSTPPPGPAAAATYALHSSFCRRRRRRSWPNLVVFTLIIQVYYYNVFISIDTHSAPVLWCHRHTDFWVVDLFRTGRARSNPQIAP